MLQLYSIIIGTVVVAHHRRLVQPVHTLWPIDAITLPVLFLRTADPNFVQSVLQYYHEIPAGLFRG